MKVTNKLNLPEPFVLYCSRDDHSPKEHRYSVTELLLPIREILLNRKYYDQIEEDVADCIPALFGTAVHRVLEENTPILEHLNSEESIECNIGEDTLSGRVDLLDFNELSIQDYKTCSVSKIMKQDFEEWKLQGLMYAYILFKKQGVIMRKLKFYALMKDWSKVKAVNSSNYPTSAIYVWEYNIADSDYDYIEKWIKDRLSLINYHLENDTLPECTDEERWYTGTKYAIYKKAGDARAAYLADTEEDAHNYITNKCNGSGEIQVRKGEYLKCRLYCNCCKFCEKGGENND